MMPRIKLKHRQLAEHYLRFTDDKSPLTDAEIAAFIRWESTGQATPGVNLERLQDAKRKKELTIKMIYEEVFSYWSRGWGWALPLVGIIEEDEADSILKANCRSIFTTLESKGVAVALLDHSEFTAEQKRTWAAARRLLYGGFPPSVESAFQSQ